MCLNLDGALWVAVCVVDEISLEGMVIHKAECRPFVSDNYMKIKKWVNLNLSANICCLTVLGQNNDYKENTKHWIELPKCSSFSGNTLISHSITATDNLTIICWKTLDPEDTTHGYSVEFGCGEHLWGVRWWVLSNIHIQYHWFPSRICFHVRFQWFLCVLKLCCYLFPPLGHTNNVFKCCKWIPNIRREHQTLKTVLSF